MVPLSTSDEKRLAARTDSALWFCLWKDTSEWIQCERWRVVDGRCHGRRHLLGRNARFQFDLWTKAHSPSPSRSGWRLPTRARPWIGLREHVLTGSYGPVHPGCRLHGGYKWALSPGLAFELRRDVPVRRLFWRLGLPCQPALLVSGIVLGRRGEHVPQGKQLPH